MNKSNVLYEYTKGQIEVNQKELEDLQTQVTEINSKINEKKTLIEALNDQLLDLKSKVSITHDSKSFNDMIFDVFESDDSREGLMVKDVVKAIRTKYAEKAPSHNYVERQINIELEKENLFQTNPGMKRNRRFKKTTPEFQEAMRRVESEQSLIRTEDLPF